MFKFFRRHRTVVMVSLALCVGGLVLFGVGGTSLMSSPQDTIVKVNGESITQMEFDRLYNQLVRQHSDGTPTQRQQMMGQALNELIRQKVFAQEAKRYGIHVTDQELQLQLAAIPAFQKDGHFDPQTYVQVVSQSVGTTVPDFEKMHKKDMAGRKLNQLVATAIHVPDSVVTAELNQRLQVEKDPKKRKELRENPELLRQELEERQINMVFSDWLNQLNSSLKVNIVSDRFQKLMNAPAPAQ